MNVSRYLTPDVKARELAYWDRTKRQPVPSRVDLGGLGYPDPPIFDLCDRLNALPGVCTLQSCAGHAGNSHGATYSGNLWLWLDELMAMKFEREVCTLAAEDFTLIERVEKLWQPDGQEIVSVFFAGQHTAGFAIAQRVILDFFARLALPEDKWIGRFLCWLGWHEFGLPPILSITSLGKFGVRIQYGIRSCERCGKLLSQR